MSGQPPQEKLSFSLGLKKPQSKPTSSSQPASKQLKKPAFGLVDSDDETPVTSEPASSSGRSWGKPKAPAPKSLMHQAVAPSRAVREKQDEALKIDQAAFAYDEVYDHMKVAQKAARQRKEDESTDRQPKYMAQAIASAATRKLDRIRAEEKMLERERQLEGDEFADKEKFVTQAYKDQMEEVRRAEEEEKAQEAKMRDSNSKGISSFYANFLAQESDAHSAAVNAALQATTTAASTPQNLTIVRPVQGPAAPPPPPMSSSTDSSTNSERQALIAARERGLDVELNDSGEVVDSRDLLSAGLNFMPKKQPLPSSLASGSSANSKAPSGPYVSKRVGAAASVKEIRARQDALLRSQMEEEERRREEEAKVRETERLIGTKEKRNDESSVGDLKARYLERKKRKLEEEAERKRKEAEEAASGGS
ncbi:Uncharacterized conserved protein [Phaffia rhodozyma]|uniref:Uncharacterized conserved protein n=1 Tax=Phaffia rhodozyma TaxID=264483 RepID=A0A0F7SJC4_PHARH|nr:Uncharacterized conserved protein [Phaffia rhodozyma]